MVGEVNIIGQSSSSQTSVGLPEYATPHSPPGSASLMIIISLDLVPAPHGTLHDVHEDHSCRHGHGNPVSQT